MLHTYFLGILLVVGSGYALYDSNSDVVDLTPDNFNRLVSDSYEVWLVEFYAPWCGHCKNLVPEYKKAAKALRGIVKVGAVDADKYKSFAKSYGVSGFPTIKIFTGDRHVPYKSARTADGFVEAALSAIKSKAYERLGKRPEDSGSAKLSAQNIYGHNIPWKQIKKTTKTAPVTTQPPPLSGDQKLNDTMETCLPDLNKTDDNQHNTTKIIARMKVSPWTPVKMKTTVKVPNTTTTKVLKTTTKAPTKSTPITTYKVPLKTHVKMKTAIKVVKTSTTKVLKTTTKAPTKSTPITTYNRLKKLQMMLLRNDIKKEQRVKITNILMRLKYVLEKKRAVNVNAKVIKRRSDKRQGRKQ